MDDRHYFEGPGFFENIKYCQICHRPLSVDFEKEMCPVCEENELFSKVRDFIRSKDVTEYDVVEEFQIPLRKVKNWIKEGRIEYKEVQHTIKELKCVVCGEAIKFGHYCQKCYKLKNTPKATVKLQEHEERIRFLDIE